MIIDEPDLMNADRLNLAADALERGEAPIVWLQKKFEHEHSYFNWLVQILRKRGHGELNAEMLACGAAFRFESEH
jgi:hypothetical protein